jgi:hypothetical protein
MASAAADNFVARSDEGNDPYNLIVSDLVALIGHVQASLRLIASAIERETLLAEQDAASNIFVLDDVTPRYIGASTALKACDAGLGIALDRLLDSEAPARVLN